MRRVLSLVTVGMFTLLLSAQAHAQTLTFTATLSGSNEAPPVAATGAGGFATITLNLTDMETCYKVMVRSVANRLDLQSRDFGIEPEITQKVAAMRARIYEVPISYHGRTYEEGKKIGLKDAFKAVYTILRFWGWKPK